MTWLQLADEVGLSPSAATERVRRLERAGVIAGYRAVISPEAIGCGIEARIAVTFRPGLDRDTFLTALTDEATIVDAVHLTGPNDYELTARCTDIDELDALLDRLKTTLEVERTDTRIVLTHPIRRDPDPTHPRTIPRPVGRHAAPDRRR